MLQSTPPPYHPFTSSNLTHRFQWWPGSQQAQPVLWSYNSLTFPLGGCWLPGDGWVIKSCTGSLTRFSFPNSEATCLAILLWRQDELIPTPQSMRQDSMWEVGNCLFTNTSQGPALPPPLNKLTIFLYFLLLLLYSLAPSNIVLHQEPKYVSNGKTKGCLVPCAACNNKPHSLKCLPKECCDGKLQRKTLAPNQTVSRDNEPLNTINNSFFSKLG